MSRRCSRGVSGARAGGSRDRGAGGTDFRERAGKPVVWRCGERCGHFDLKRRDASTGGGAGDVNSAVARGKVGTDGCVAA